jgi:phosphatidylglycerophosphate synthase
VSDAPPAPPPPAEKAPGDLAHACVMLAAIALTLLAANLYLLVAVAWAAFARLVWRGRASWMPVRFGVPNTVTVLRLGLITALLLGSTRYPGDVLAGLGIAVYVFDGLDGQIARNFNLATEFGAEFDTEADAFYIAALSLGLWARGVADAWVLLPGLLRYLYVITVTVFRWRGEAPREKFSRYSFSITAVLLSLAFWPSAAAPWAAMVGTLVVSAAFWNSWTWAVRRAPAPG